MSAIKKASYELMLAPAVLLIVTSFTLGETQGEKPPRLTASEHTLLDRQKLLLTKTCYKQIFVPYVEPGDCPVFITSDSILNTFHVMLEDALFQNEADLAEKIGPQIQIMFRSIRNASVPFPVDAALATKSKRRVTIFLGVALRLVDEFPSGIDAEMMKVIESETDKILAATEISKPKWLGAPDPSFLAIDYSKFKPMGFYARTPALKRYFRLIRWLQTIPFRLEREEELLAIAYFLQGLDAASKELKHDLDSLPDRITGKLARNDGLQLFSSRAVEFNFYREFVARRSLSEFRSQPSFQSIEPGINDLIRFEPTQKDGKPEPQARFLCGLWTPENELFQRTANSDNPQSRTPYGLQVAAMLGSKFATEELRSTLTKSQFDLTLNTIKSLKPLESQRIEYLYSSYLQCIALLCDESNGKRPELFRSTPWRRKNCQSVLASWAQMRHTLQLHLKDSIIVSNGADHPPGFVEPYPEFYRSLGLLARQAEVAFPNGAAKTLDNCLAQFAKRCARLAASRERWAKDQSLPLYAGDDESENEFWSAVFLCTNDFEGFRKPTLPHEAVRGAEELKNLALRALRSDVPVTLKELLGKAAKRNSPVDWSKLRDLCAQLEIIATKQLDNLPLSTKENQTVIDYGKIIADLMGYHDYMYFYPRDDAPRTVIVHAEREGRGNLHAAVGRPREMYILYPQNGKEILCRGAVMPYYEFYNDARLTNAEWMTKLDSANAPKPPEWAKELYIPAADRTNLPLKSEGG